MRQKKREKGNSPVYDMIYRKSCSKLFHWTPETQMKFVIKLDKFTFWGIRLEVTSLKGLSVVIP